jgi:hypothetical protein
MLWAVDEPLLRAFGVDTPFWDADAQCLKISRRQSPRDERMARRHAVLFPQDRGFTLSDVSAGQDTYVDGDRLEGSAAVQHGSIVRTGGTVWIVLRDVSRFESASLDPTHGLELADRMPSEDPVGSAGENGIPWLQIPFLIHRAAGGVAVDASLVERCLLSFWPDGEALVAAIQAALRRCADEGGRVLLPDHLDPVRPLRPALPFAQHFELVMGVPPPFDIPPDYKVLIRGKREGVFHEMLIGSPEGPSFVDQAFLGLLANVQPGWFQAGFWGHGINSYSVYLGRATERYTLFLRLPYGAGACSSDRDRERRGALERLVRYQKLAETLPVRRAVLVDSLGTAYYELERSDGSIVKSAGELESLYSFSSRHLLHSLDQVDLLALATASS